LAQRGWEKDVSNGGKKKERSIAYKTMNRRVRKGCNGRDPAYGGEIKDERARYPWEETIGAIEKRGNGKK